MPCERRELLCDFSTSCMRAGMHVHTHARMHACTHARTCACQTDLCGDAGIADTHVDVYASFHTHIDTHISMHTSLRMSKCMPSHTSIHMTSDYGPHGSHTCLGHNCTDHNYVGHNYVGHNYICHTCIGHDYIGHNYMDHLNLWSTPQSYPPQSGRKIAQSCTVV